MDLVDVFWVQIAALLVLSPLGATLGAAHANLFGLPVAVPVPRDLSPASVHYDLGGTALWVGLGLAVWIAVLAVDLGLIASVSSGAVPFLAFAVLYSLGVADTLPTLRPRIGVTIGLHRVVVRRSWVPGLTEREEVGVERILRVRTVPAGPGARQLLLETRDGQTIRVMPGPTSLIDHLAEEIEKVADPPDRGSAPVPRALDALLERAQAR